MTMKKLPRIFSDNINFNVVIFVQMYIPLANYILSFQNLHSIWSIPVLLIMLVIYLYWHKHTTRDPRYKKSRANFSIIIVEQKTEREHYITEDKMNVEERFTMLFYASGYLYIVLKILSSFKLL